MADSYYAVIPDAGGRRLLLLRSDEGWEIPHWQPSAVEDTAAVAEVNQTVQDLLGLEATTLRRLRNPCPEEGRTIRFFELEPHGPERLPAGSAWLDREELQGVELAEPQLLPLLVGCLDERGGEAGDSSVEWARPGWLDTAVAWIDEQVASLGLDAGAIVQERTWSISTVLRIPTTGGDLYFKASPAVFASEPALTRELSRSHPGLAPDVVALDRERRWLLMRDVDGSALPAGIASRCEALRAYVRLQIEWIDQVDDLLALGCPDRRLEVLEREIDRVLGDTDALLPGQPPGLSPDELLAVPALADGLRAACGRLRACDLPATLEHGDLHAGNIRAAGGSFVFFDWSDGCVSVPFFSLVPLLEFEQLAEPSNARELLRDAFLEPWLDHVSAERLEEAFDLSQFLGLFHQALSYYRIVERTEPRARWEWQNVFPSLVRALLERQQASSRARRSPTCRRRTTPRRCGGDGRGST